MTIDPRLETRRQEVAEGQAHRSANRTLKWLVFFGMVGLVIWLAFSPFFSVATVHTEGVVNSATNSILVEGGVKAGTPMFAIGTAEVEALLMVDPWVAGASVVRHWPDQVVVTVTERHPVAWVEDGTGWSRRSVDGHAVPSSSAPEGSLPTIRLDSVNRSTTDHPDLLGALEFSAYLGDTLGPVEVFKSAGELWAVVQEHSVRLGRPIDMTAKAAALGAMLEKGVPDEAVIILVSPSNPATQVPQPSPDGGD